MIATGIDELRTHERFGANVIDAENSRPGFFLRNQASRRRIVLVNRSTRRRYEIVPLELAACEREPASYTDPFGLCPPQDTNFGPECPGYFASVGGAIGLTIGAFMGGLGGGGGGLALCAAGGPLAAGCAAAGGVAGAASGGAKGAGIGAAAGALVDAVVQMARAGKGRGANQNPNRDVQRIVRENDLNRTGQRALHDEITGQNYSLDEIRDIAARLAEQAKYRINPPPQP